LDRPAEQQANQQPCLKQFAHLFECEIHACLSMRIEYSFERCFGTPLPPAGEGSY
jgi:hypothetical protein